MNSELFLFLLGFRPAGGGIKGTSLASETQVERGDSRHTIVLKVRSFWPLRIAYLRPTFGEAANTRFLSKETQA